jgi:hypothetical protein
MDVWPKFVILAELDSLPWKRNDFRILNQAGLDSGVTGGRYVSVRKVVRIFCSYLHRRGFNDVPIRLLSAVGVDSPGLYHSQSYSRQYPNSQLNRSLAYLIFFLE